MTSRGLEIIEEDDCRLLLRKRSLGASVSTWRGTSRSFRVYYGFLDGDVVFRTDPVRSSPPRCSATWWRSRSTAPPRRGACS
jgi:hypothetical protein